MLRISRYSSSKVLLVLLNNSSENAGLPTASPVDFPGSYISPFPKVLHLSMACFEG